MSHPSHLPILRNGPAGRFVVLSDGVVIDTSASAGG